MAVREGEGYFIQISQIPLSSFFMVPYWKCRGEAGREGGREGGSVCEWGSRGEWRLWEFGFHALRS